MGHLNSFLASGGGNLNKNFPKIQMPGGLPGGDVEASIWLVHKEIIDGHSPSVIVVIPLRSIVQEQLASNEFNLKAVELSLQHDVLKTVSECEVEVVYDKFLSILRNSNSPFRRHLKLIVVDESHKCLLGEQFSIFETSLIVALGSTSWRTFVWVLVGYFGRVSFETWLHFSSLLNLPVSLFLNVQVTGLSSGLYWLVFLVLQGERFEEARKHSGKITDHYLYYGLSVEVKYYWQS